MNASSHLPEQDNQRLILEPHLRLLLGLALLILVLLPMVVMFLVREEMTQQVITATESEAIKTGQHLAFMLLPDNREIGHTVVNQSVQNQFTALMGQLGLIKIKLFSPTGEIIYSSDPTIIGTLNTHSYFSQSVAQGAVFTKIVRKTERSVENEPVPVDVVETYVPLMDGDRFLGAFELYYDMTQSLRELHNYTVRLMTGLTIVSIMLGIGLFIVWRQARIALLQREHLTSKIKQSEEQFRNMASLAQDAIILVDDQEHITFWNRAAEVIFGYSATQAIKHRLSTLIIPSNHHTNIQIALLDSRKREVSSGHTLEIMTKHKDGSTLPTELSIASMKRNNTWYSLLIARNISERRRIEQQKQFLAYNSGIAEMSIVVMHNIGNAIMGVQNRSEFIQRHAIPLREITQLLQQMDVLAEQKKKAGWTEHQLLSELLKVVTETGASLSDRINQQVLDPTRAILSGIEQITEVLRVHHNVTSSSEQSDCFDPKSLLFDALMILDKSLLKLGIATQLHPTELPEEVHLPRAPLIHAFVNILEHCIQSISTRRKTEPELIAVIKIHSRMLETQHIEIIIEDNGTDIRPDKLINLFSFNQTRGLHLASTFVQSIGGKIRAEPLNPGTSIILELPLKNDTKQENNCQK
ncbi:MAG: PAS domain S-box protein [Magnetococcales bacterium]|nr:PAS domain S-box protein [Magnetococcales bacterium]